MTSKTLWTLGILAMAGVGGALALQGSDAPEPPPLPTPVEAPSTSVAAGVLTVWKSPSCGCCSGWVDHMRSEGFEVEVHDVADIEAVKAERGVPGDMASCHTALIDGYLVEGHVPASDVRRLLAERPELAGIAAPGMPVGSPGMEVPGRRADTYQVIGFTKGAERTVFSQH